MTALALILGRAGSRAVPGKNTAEVGGRPCVEWTIDHAREARTIHRIAVSTDCPRLARCAHDRAIEVIDRPPDLATDHATVDDAARHALSALDDADLREVCILYANVPVRPRGLIDRALGLLRETGADSVQSYQPVGKYHPWWMTRIQDDGTVIPWEGTVLNHGVYRRQELPPACIPDGGVLVVTRRALDLELPGVPPGPHAFLGLDRRALLNPEGSVIDIDAPTDLLVATAVIRHSETTCASEHAGSERTAART